MRQPVNASAYYILNFIIIPITCDLTWFVNESEMSIDKRPTRRPTLRPTQPKIIKKISFLVMGDTPYTKEARYCLNRQLRDIDQSQMDFKFLAHVGDLKWGKTKCYPSSFKDVAEIISHSKNAKGYDTRDFFIVPGDNEFQDCKNQFTNGSAWRWFMQCK